MTKWVIITCKDKYNTFSERFVIDEQNQLVVSGIIPAYFKYFMLKRLGGFDFVSISRW